MRTNSVNNNEATPSRCAARIRLERGKRSWTQERLGEETGLSSRTIQRMESGQSLSRESLRLVEEAFELPEGELSAHNERHCFKAPYFTQKWRYPALVFATIMMFLCVVLQVFSIRLALTSGEHIGLGIWAIFAWCAFLNTSLIVNVFFFYVHGYVIEKGVLHVLHRGWSSKYDLSQVTGIEICPEALGAFPILFLTGFNFSSLYYASSIGLFRGMHVNGLTCVLLHFGKRKIMVSPDDPEAFVSAVQERLLSILGEDENQACALSTPNAEAE